MSSIDMNVSPAGTRQISPGDAYARFAAALVHTPRMSSVYEAEQTLEALRQL